MENAIKERSVESSNTLELENTLEKWKAKALHGQFIRDTESKVSPLTWYWLRFAGMKAPTEGLLLASQDQALPTNHNKARIIRPK